MTTNSTTNSTNQTKKPSFNKVVAHITHELFGEALSLEDALHDLGFVAGGFERVLAHCKEDGVRIPREAAELLGGDGDLEVALLTLTKEEKDALYTQYGDLGGLEDAWAVLQDTANEGGDLSDWGDPAENALDFLDHALSF